MALNSLFFYVRNSDGSQVLSAIKWNNLKPGEATDPVNLRLYNNSGQATSETLMGACRGDTLREQLTGETTAEANSTGQELMTEKWLELRLLVTDPWTPVSFWKPDMIDFGAMNNGTFKDFQARVNIPAGASTVGTINWHFLLAAR